MPIETGADKLEAAKKILSLVESSSRNDAANVSYSEFTRRLSFVKRRRLVLLALICSSPWLYKFIKTKVEQTGMYRRHRQRNESFSQHLVQAEKRISGTGAASQQSGNAATKKRGALDSAFFKRLRLILKIVIPSWKSKEMLMLFMHSLFLIARTYLSVVVARVDGMIVKELVAGNSRGFWKGLGFWFAIAVPATYTNSMIRYLQSKLGIAFRTRLTNHVHEKYFDQMTYYKVLNLDGRLDGVDQLICTDIAKFCDALASLYSNLAKPFLDTLIFNYQLAKSIGSLGMVALFVNYAITASILRAISPGFGKLAAVEAKLEGDFRSAHSRLIMNSEEIAFYHGGAKELSILDKTYRTLMRHINRIYRIRIFYNMFEDFIIKYSWSAAGLLVSSVPVFFPSFAGSLSQSKNVSKTVDPLNAQNKEVVAAARAANTRDFITNKRLMISLADAGGRMMYSYKEMSELAGFTARVAEMLEVFEDMRQMHYSRQTTTSSESNNITNEYSLSEINGDVSLDQNKIELDHAPIVTPSGETLIKDLSFVLAPGMHALITGPNGVGKSSIVKVISGLWPLLNGKLLRPADSSIIFIPQRPYLSMGSLREQVIYPHSNEEMRTSGRSDEDLMRILEIVHLSYLPDREGGWDTVKEWKDVLSGGEKQRMNLARLFYHHPRFAVLDECSSAVSNEVEGLMYQKAKDMGISFLTISHRPSLMKYHEYLLTIPGSNQSWSWKKITTEVTRMTVETELFQLEQKLGEETKLRQRLTEINAALGVKLNATKK